MLKAVVMYWGESPPRQLCQSPAPQDQNAHLEIESLRMRFVKMRSQWSRVSCDPTGLCLHKKGKCDNSGQTQVCTGTTPVILKADRGLGGGVGGCMYKPRNVSRAPESERRGTEPSRPRKEPALPARAFGLLSCRTGHGAVCLRHCSLCCRGPPAQVNQRAVTWHRLG